MKEKNPLPRTDSPPRPARAQKISRKPVSPKAGPAKAGSEKAGPEKPGSAKPGAGKAGPEKAEPAKTVSGTTERKNDGEEKTLPRKTTPRKPAPGKTVPDKAETSLLEPFSSLGLDRIHTPETPEHFAAVLAEIRAKGVVGFDTETRPVFARGAVRDGPDIVQFATEDLAFIFQVRRPESLAALTEILQSPEILKVGFDLGSDCDMLHRRLGIKAQAVLDLCTVFKKRGYRNTTGVRGAVGLVLNRRFHKSKHVTTSNWSTPHLTAKQLEYAANDAYAALMVWKALGRPPLPAPRQPPALTPSARKAGRERS